MDAVPPTVSSIAITSDPGEDDTYQRGDLIEVTVTFSEDVEVRNRRILVNGLIRRTLPQLKLDIGGEVRTANYLRAKGKEAVFYYTVQDGDTDSNGIAIRPVQTFPNAWGASPYAVFIDRGAYFVDDAQNGAAISYDALDDEVGHQVDGLSSALTVSGDTTVRYRENRDDSIGDYAVSGSDGDITWSLSGDDADNFSVNGNNNGTGELSFKSAPSYEDPSDADGDNYYRVTIAASDGTSTGSLQVIVAVARSNEKAAGVPMIGGIAKVRHQLTVDTSGITDDDGMTNAYFTYEWLADDSYFTYSVRGPTHTVRSRDVGKTIRVRVLFTDDAGNEEMLTSEATGAVVPNRPPAPWSLSFLSSVTEDNDVFLDWVGLSFTDETVNGHRIYRHRPDEGETEAVVLVENTNSSTTEWTDEDAVFGTRYIYHVAAISPTGISELSDPYEVTVGIPAVVGTPKNGQELSADTSGIWKPAWPRNGTYSFRYQWLANGAVLNDAYHVTYTPSAEDIGKTITVRVSFTDNDGNEITLTSVATTRVSPRPNSPATGAPFIYGRAEVEQRLRADITDIEDENGMTVAKPRDWSQYWALYYLWTGSYQWIRSDGTTDTAIPGATDSSYVLVADDVGQNIKLRVSFTDDEGYEETLTSSATDAVSPRPNSPATGSVRISNHARQGQTLTAWTHSISDADGLSGSSFSYQWIRNDGTADSEISGATGSEYTLVSEDVGKIVKARVSFTDDSGTEETLVSVGTHPVVRALNSSEWSPLNYVTVVIGRSDLDPDRIITNFNVTWNDTLDCSPGYNAYLIATNIRYSGDTPNSREILQLGSAGSDGTRISGELTSISTDTDIDFADVELYCGTEEAGRLVSMTRVGLFHPTEYPVGPGDRESITADRILVGSYSSQSRLSQLTFSHGTLTPLLKNHTFVYSHPNFKYTVPDVPKSVQRITITATPDTGYAVEFFEGANVPRLVTGIYSVGPDGTVPAECDYMNVGLDRLTDADPDLPGFQANLEEGDNLLIVQVYPTSPCTTGFFYPFTVTRTGNSLPTGLPTISGTAQVGETLTADTSGIADADGLTNDSFTYQWLADDTEIASATGNTYVLTSAELGKAVKVRVSFADDAGNEEALMSASTTAVAAAPPPPPDNVRAVTQESGAVELTWEAPQDGTVTGYRIERSRADENRAGQQRSAGSPKAHHTLVEDTRSANTSYTDESAEQGVEYEYRVSARNEAGTGEASEWVRAGPESASNSPATGAPTIRGTTQVGETLTADITGISDADGLSGETFTYQWVSGDGTTDTDIENATGSTYTLVAADQGRSVKVRVTFTDDGGNEKTLTSAPTAPVLGDGLPGAPRNLTATPGNKEVTLSWEPPADNGNAPPTGYRIEWRVDGKDYENHWGTARSTTYTTNDNANLANGVKYFFRVKAGNGSGYSQGPYGPASGEVSATPTSGSAVDLGTPVLSDTENLHHGMVQLDWEDVEDAGWYVVQYYHVKGGEWLDLPAVGVDIAFHGSSAVVSNLHGLSWLRVRAMSCAGESEWSQIEQLFGTNASDWEGVPVPEVAEGDQIEPCPVVLGTPVLSEPENLHHGMVRLDWQDIEDAGWYVVQYYHIDGGSGEWVDLPAEGVDIAFHGSSAVVSNLHGLSWLRVRAMGCDGTSEWSQIEQLFGTNASDWEGVPVPEVAEGDEIEPCSEDADTSDNSPATGAPDISGTAQVGETLTADTSGIADADGLANATFSYQWLADDADINGATGSTYTLTDSDEGKAVKVEVSFTDDAGNHETLTSGATDAAAAQINSPATGAPTISGTAQVGETLTADTSGIADADGLSNVQYQYQWLADDADISGATNATYTLAAEDEGKAIKVEVSFTDDADNEETLTSAGTDAAAAASTRNSPATGVPTISGTAQVGETLTADTSGIADADGMENAAVAFYWGTYDNATGQNLLRMIDSEGTYTIEPRDVGMTIHVHVTFEDDRGNVESTKSAPTDTVKAAPTINSLATGAPTISGTAQVGEALTADTSDIADADGLSNVQYEYQWLADDTDISGATASTYTLVAADEGKAIQVKVSFTDDGGNSETLTSAGTDAVLASSQADSEDESSLRSYITVVVAEDTSDPDNPQTDFTITWSDTDTCSTGYNAYLNIEPGNRPGHETPGSQLDLGSSASDGALITKSLSGVQGSVEGFNVELYCGTYGSGRLVSTVEIPMAYGRPMPETYSSEPPLNALSVSHGTLTPAFNSHTFRYAVPDVANADTRITITAIPKTGYAIDLLESSGGRVGKIIAEARRPGGPASGLSSDCRRSHSDALGQLIELTDADPDTPGFQVDLYDGENHVYVPVYPIAYCILDTGYALAITRAEGSVSLPRPNRPAIGAPTISGAPLVGRTLNTHTSEIRDRDGLSNATFKYQWLADDADISEATNATYTLADADEGKAIKVEVSFTDDAGNGETLTSAATGAVDTRPNSPATGAPTITGTAQVGEMLTAHTSGIADADGLSNVQYDYQWLADDTDIAGATGLTYTLTDSEESKAITVQVSFTDDADNQETLTSGATDTVEAAPTTNSPATGAPTITGTAQVGETLTANTSGVADADGLSNVQYEYQWLADDAEVAGATGSTYTLVADDMGKAISVSVSFTDDADNEETLTSGATEAAAARPNSLATGAPTISGTVQVGETLTANTSGIADADGLDDVSFTYQWLADDSDISGATNATYTLAAADEGKTIKVQVSFTDDADNDETLTSAATAAVAAAEPSEPPAKPRGLEATVSNGQVVLTWDDPQDDSVTGYVILRRVRENDQGGEFSVLVPDTGSAAATYTDDTVAASTTYTYRIKAINGAGTSERSRWVHIDIPAAPVPDKPTGLSATATHDSITLTWDDPGDDSITGYVILRRNRDDDPKGHFDELAADTGTADTTYTDDTVAAGTSYTYRIKAINGAGPGERSRWYHIDTPAAPEPAN